MSSVRTCPGGAVRSRAVVRLGGARRRLSSRVGDAEAEFQGFLGMENSHVVYGIMGANVLVFLGWHGSDDLSFMRKNFTLSAQQLSEGRFHTLLTSVFSHNELNRLMAATAGIFLVAAPAIATLGQARFAALYAAGGVASAITGIALASRSDRAKRAAPMTWRFGGTGAVLSVAAFTACQLPNIPKGPKLALGPAVAAQALVFMWVGTHSEGDWGHLAGAVLGVVAFFATRRFHPGWRAAVRKFHSM